MDQDHFDEHKYEIIEYIKEFRNKYQGKTDGIAKIRLIGDADEAYGNWRTQEMPSQSDLVDIEDSGMEEHDADTDEHEDENKLLEENECDMFIMFEDDGKLHTLRELTIKDKEGNAKFPAWLPENNFMPNSVFNKGTQQYILKKRYLEEGWHNAFVVFVIYGEEELEEDKPITEASRIILKETQYIPELGMNVYSIESLKTKWNEYAHDHSDMYDKKWFAIITTKAIRETINWAWICTKLNDTESIESDDESESESEDEDD